jgi:hypothetical protein
VGQFNIGLYRASFASFCPRSVNLTVGPAEKMLNEKQFAVRTAQVAKEVTPIKNSL